MSLLPIEARKASIATALDSSINVIVETKRFVEKERPILTAHDQEKIADVLKGMGRICFQTAQDIEEAIKR